MLRTQYSMLHQTLPLFFQFNLSPSFSSSSLLPSSSSSSLSQVEPEMECVAAKNAFKTSFWPEITVKSNQAAVFEDFYGGNVPNCGVSVDEFLVDEFLDFSEEEQRQEQEQEEEEKDCSSFSSQEPNTNSSGLSVKDDFGFVSGSEFTVPTDEMEDLEWLSRFVDDSFSEFALPYLERNSPDKTPVLNSDRSEPESRPTSPAPHVTFPTPVPARARTKRPRTAGRVWSIGTPAITETSSSSSSSSSSFSSSTSTSTSCLIFTNTGPNLEFLDHVGKPPEKKQKKIPATKNSVTQPQRRCSHCGVQKTPQWRAGPLGAKTLCNACGVRFKSGRLLPEYRPACSPTFSSDVHSNSHRKVLEMRRKKEMDRLESEFAPAVQSF